MPASNSPRFLPSLGSSYAVQDKALPIFPIPLQVSVFCASTQFDELRLVVTTCGPFPPFGFSFAPIGRVFRFDLHVFEALHIAERHSLD